MDADAALRRHTAGNDRPMRAPHAFLSGLVGGLVLSQETLVVLAVGVAIGAAGAALVRGAAAAAGWVRRRVEAGRPYDHARHGRYKTW